MRVTSTLPRAVRSLHYLRSTRALIFLIRGRAAPFAGPLPYGERQPLLARTALRRWTSASVDLPDRGEVDLEDVLSHGHERRGEPRRRLHLLRRRIRALDVRARRTHQGGPHSAPRPRPPRILLYGC